MRHPAAIPPRLPLAAALALALLAPPALAAPDDAEGAPAPVPRTPRGRAEPLLPRFLAEPLPQETGERADPGEPPAAGEEEKEEESPWMLAPILTVNPKLGASGGALAGFLHRFDPKSQVSIFAVSGQYTSTGSVVAGTFAKTSFLEDRHRLVAGLLAGNIKNDYKDFLGTGVPLKSEDQLRGFIARYLYRFHGPWFGGVQAMVPNFTTFGVDPGDTLILNTLGLTGFDAAGVGLAAYHDSRDNDTMPTEGWLFNLNNVAFRDEIGGDFDFDVYRGDVRGFLPHGAGHVLAIRQYNQWTVDAPPSGLAPVQLRGYKLGQYLGQHMSSLEAEQRWKLADRWTASLFAGVAALYGDGLVASERDNLFPAAGLGLQFVLKKEKKIALNLEFAFGKEGNYGLYLRIGYSF